MQLDQRRARGAFLARRGGRVGRDAVLRFGLVLAFAGRFRVLRFAVRFAAVLVLVRTRVVAPCFFRFFFLPFFFTRSGSR